MSSIGPSLPPEIAARLKKRAQEETNQSGPSENETNQLGPSIPDEGSIGPALPPGFKKSDNSEVYGPPMPKYRKPTASIGPLMPASLSKDDGVYGPEIPGKTFQEPKIHSRKRKISEEDDFMIGPALPTAIDKINNSSNFDAVVEIEKRSQKMRDKLDGKEEVKLEREEWMLELPSAKEKFGMGPRQFRRKEKVIGDRSVWTDTPQDKARKEKEKESKEMLEFERQQKFIEKDREIEEKLKKMNGESSRNESLMDMHDKKRKKKEKKDKKKKKKNKKKDKDERRPFDRDLDLGVNKFDNAAKKRMLKQAAELGSRFQHSTSGSKFI